MNRDTFNRLITDQSSLHEMAVAELEELVRSYPYCQSSRILLTRLLKLEEHITYDEVLKTTAIYAGDRRMLKKRLESPITPMVVETPEEEAKETFATAAEKISPDTEPETQDQTAENEKDTVELEEETARPHAGEIVETAVGPGETERKELSEPLEGEESTEERMRRLKAIVEARLRQIEKERKSSKKTAAEKSEPKEKKEAGKSSADLIDEFIRKQPSISRPQAAFFKPEEAARESVVDEEDIVSETLARIYFDQKNFAKAISIYRKLSLIYPEKSSYFAAQIEKAVEELKK